MKLDLQWAAKQKNNQIISTLVCLCTSLHFHTDELCHRVVLSLRADRSCDAVVLQDGQEKLNKVWGVWRSDHIQHLQTQRGMGLLYHSHIRQHPVSPHTFFLVSRIRSARYLCDKVSNERDIRVEFLQTFANVTDYRQHVSTAQKVNHSVQQSLLQLQLTGTSKATQREPRGGLIPMSWLTEKRRTEGKPAPWHPAGCAPSQTAW